MKSNPITTDGGGPAKKSSQEPDFSNLWQLLGCFDQSTGVTTPSNLLRNIGLWVQLDSDESEKRFGRLTAEAFDSANECDTGSDYVQFYFSRSYTLEDVDRLAGIDSGKTGAKYLLRQCTAMEGLRENLDKHGFSRLAWDYYRPIRIKEKALPARVKLPRHSNPSADLAVQLVVQKLSSALDVWLAAINRAELDTTVMGLE